MKLSLEDLQQTVNALVVCKGDKTSAAKSLGIPRTTFNSRIELAERSGITPNVVPPDMEAELYKVKLTYEDKIRELERKLRETVRAELTSDYIRKYIYGFSKNDLNPPKWTYDIGKSKGQLSTPMLLLSDLHFGEVVDPKQIANAGVGYNIEIATNRLQRVIDTAVDLSMNHIAPAKYPGIVVMLGGDLVSGIIHPELVETNDGRASEHMFGLVSILCSSISFLADVFGRVHIVCVAGNHGRMTQKPIYKDAAFTNFDWQIGMMIKSYFKTTKDDRISVDIPDGFDALFTVSGHRFLLTHGDRIGNKGGDGILGPIVGITKGILKVKAQYASMGHIIDTVAMGHFHRAIDPEGGIVNGSLIGVGEHSFGSRYTIEEPVQRMWFVHPSYGITFHTKLYAEKTEKGPKDDAWIKHLA